MVNRDRAWRRRTAHIVAAREDTANDALARQSVLAKPGARPHAAQKLRVLWGTEHELREAA